MSDVDERVVSMKFNNTQFESGVKNTMSTLDKLKAGLKMDGAKKGLEGVDAASKKLNFANLASGVENIGQKFSALGIAGVTAIASITTKLVDMGLQMAKGIAIDPIMEGFKEYETQINSVQTIMANTASQGTTLKQVNAALKELNTYSDKTIYNFTEMSKNIGTFTAAGVDLKTSTAAIKGIANLAAVSGSNSQQASTAMYQLSQALASGSVKLQDWNSVVNAGMGGQVFKDALVETAKVHGVKIDEMIKKEGSFRETLKNGWLTSKVLTETLSKFTGDLNEEQLKGMGYSKKQIAEIIKLGKMSNDAATKVKTFSQLIDTLKEAVGSGWSQTWMLVFGDFEEAKKLYTGISNVLGGLINDSSDARNKVVTEWKDAGGRTAIIYAIKNAFDALMGIAKVVGEAMAEIFPPMTGKQLADLSTKLEMFTAGLKLGGDELNNLKRTFKGIFAIFSIAGQIIGGVIGVIWDLFTGVGEGTGSFLEFTGGIGDWIVSLDEAMKKGDGLKKFFEGLKAVIAVPIAILKTFANLISTAFSGDTGGGASGFGEKISAAFEPLKALGDGVAAAWTKMVDVVVAAYGWMKPVIDAIAAAFSWLGGQISAMVSNFTVLDFGRIFNIAMIGVILMKLKGFISGLKGGIEDGKGIIGQLKGILEGVTGSLEAMQQNLKAGTLIKIAGALALLTLSIVALSMIDAGNLAKAMIALQIMFVQLNAAMKMFEKTANSKGFYKLPVLAATLILLGAALLILSAAVAVLASLSWEQLAKGLIGVGGLLAALGLFTKLVKVNKKGLSQGVGLILLAVAIKILASAVKDFGSMDIGTIAKGLGAVILVLGALAGFSQITKGGSGIAGTAVGLLLIGAAMKVLASAIGDMGSMSMEQLAKGLLGLTTALLLMVVAMNMMPKDMGMSAAALVVVAVAMKIVGDVLKDMGKMSWEEIAKGLVTLAGALIIIAAASLVMEAAIGGAVAIAIVAGSLALLGPVLTTFAKLSWEEIGKSMTMLAGAFLILGLAGLVLTPVIPSLLGLGVAILLIGAGALLAGVGLLALAVGLTALAAAGAAGAAGLSIMVMALASLLPFIAQKIGEAIVALIQAIAGSIDAVVQAFVTIFMGILKAVVIVIPALAKAAVKLIKALVSALVVLVPFLVEAGFRILIGFLKGVRDHIGDVVDLAGDIIVKFIKAMGRNANKVADAGADTIISFIKGLTRTINKKSGEMRKAGGELAMAIINGMTGGLADNAWRVINAAVAMAWDVFHAAMKALGASSPSKRFYELGGYSAQGMALGILAKKGLAETAAVTMGNSVMDKVKEAMRGISDIDTGLLDATPVITPILDLSSIEKKSKDISGILDQKAISVDKAYAETAAISADQVAAASVANSVVTEPAQPLQVTFNQTNNSPAELSTIDIYRNTRNQISQMKGVLKV